jgi:hypothetical protein
MSSQKVLGQNCQNCIYVDGRLILFKVGFFSSYLHKAIHKVFVNRRIYLY